MQTPAKWGLRVSSRNAATCHTAAVASEAGSRSRTRRARQRCGSLKTEQCGSVVVRVQWALTDALAQPVQSGRHPRQLSVRSPRPERDRRPSRYGSGCALDRGARQGEATLFLTFLAALAATAVNDVQQRPVRWVRSCTFSVSSLRASFGSPFRHDGSHHKHQSTYLTGVRLAAGRILIRFESSGICVFQNLERRCVPHI
jgi:hypothetical protein